MDTLEHDGCCVSSEVSHYGNVAGVNQPQLKQSEVIDLRVPEEAIPGSEKCVVNVIGEYLLSYRDDSGTL